MREHNHFKSMLESMFGHTCLIVSFSPKLLTSQHVPEWLTDSNKYLGQAIQESTHETGFNLEDKPDSEGRYRIPEKQGSREYSTGTKHTSTSIRAANQRGQTVPLATRPTYLLPRSVGALHLQPCCRHFILWFGQRQHGPVRRVHLCTTVADLVWAKNGMTHIDIM